jgi:hypothetical protein
MTDESSAGETSPGLVMLLLLLVLVGIPWPGPQRLGANHSCRWQFLRLRRIQFVFARNAGYVDRAVKQQALPEALQYIWQDYSSTPVQ